VVDATLAKRWQAGETVARIAAALGRSEGAIRARLLRLGITENAALRERECRATGPTSDAPRLNAG
jgi:Fe2+ transport system protein FeoA